MKIIPETLINTQLDIFFYIFFQNETKIVNSSGILTSKDSQLNKAYEY
jgi:hypothetical protein